MEKFTVTEQGEGGGQTAGSDLRDRVSTPGDTSGSDLGRTAEAVNVDAINADALSDAGGTDG